MHRFLLSRCFPNLVLFVEYLTILLFHIIIFCIHISLQYLREGLSRIDESWAAARFDSLPHVVHILTSKDCEGEIQFLREQSDLVEDIVDEVVHAYHHGFNKAIQNYSQVSLPFPLAN